MVPQLFTAGGNRSYLEFWIVIGDLRYLRYKTPTVAPEPSVGRVARVVHSMRDIIGTHMILRVPPRDSKV
jgi:hypothetical protein